MIKLYRGFQINDKEIKRVKKNINGYIEIEGFLSTTLSESLTAFIVNARMIIEVPVINLGGIHDNGFANIFSYSVHPSEKEVLVNALNVFKILSLHSSAEDNGMVIHTVHLEYGGVKPVEKKIQKSDRLLDAEYFHLKKCKELEEAKKALEINKDKISAK